MNNYCTGCTKESLKKRSRRQRRYYNRRLKRMFKQQRLQKYNNFDNIARISAIYKAAKKASKNVIWKASVQHFILGILFKAARLSKQLYQRKDIRQGFIEFTIAERGKLRHIKSVHFSERVVQKSLCNNTLYPLLTYNLITDNYSSQKGKGTHFAESRLVKYLHKYYRKYGSKGYILCLDFKDYFASIPHDILKRNLRQRITDEKLLSLADSFIDAFGGQGLGLGSETSQLNAIAHINKIDHYIKEKTQAYGYGRYNDDTWILHSDKVYLQTLLQQLELLYAEMGVTLNKKKTAIKDIRHGFTFLKTRFYLTDTGKVIKKPVRFRITQERRRLKRQARLYEKGILTLEDIQHSYNSWRGTMLHRNARRTLYTMDKLYDNLFKKEKKNECIDRT